MYVDVATTVMVMPNIAAELSQDKLLASYWRIALLVSVVCPLSLQSVRTGMFTCSAEEAFAFECV